MSIPDAKAAKLAEIGYTFKPTCGLCSFSIFALHTNSPHGICNRTQYEPRPGEPKRKLPIHVLGSCSAFEAEDLALADLGSFGAFAKEIA